MSEKQIKEYAELVNRNFYQRSNTNKSELERIYFYVIDEFPRELSSIAPYIYSEKVLNNGVTNYNSVNGIKEYLDKALQNQSLQEEKGHGMTR